MHLNLPILDKLADAKNILIAGAGGGFDVFVGLPLYFTLCEAGKSVHLANYSFSPFDLMGHYAQIESLIADRLLGVSGPVSRPLPYFPEGYLAHWFHEVYGETVTLWMFSTAGAATLRECYQTLIDYLKIDAIILVDGGVDSLMRGDEPQPGTLLEDAITLSAVETLDVSVKILSALGFGTEVEDGIMHYHVLENIAALAKQGAFLGTCSLTPQMPAFQSYEQAARFVFEQPFHQKSRIGLRIIPAAHGEFGNFHLYPEDDEIQTPVLISPLLNMYWFFEADAVSRQSFITEALRYTTTSREAFMVCGRVLQQLQKRPVKRLPY